MGFSVRLYFGMCKPFFDVSFRQHSLAHPAQLKGRPGRPRRSKTIASDIDPTQTLDLKTSSLGFRGLQFPRPSLQNLSVCDQALGPNGALRLLDCPAL